MIEQVAAAIEARLHSLGIFKAVERTVNHKVLQTPPSVALFLARDREVEDDPTVTRELGWDLVLMIPALGTDRGQKSSGDCIDAVRNAFVGWLPWETGGVMPAKVPEIRLEGIEQTMLVYTVRLTMSVMPEHIQE